MELVEPEEMARVLPEQGITFLPFHEVPVIYTDRDGVTRVGEMYWQLIHYWNKEFKSPYTQFNTRAESLRKRHNRELLERRRCVFPVSSFYETRKVGGKAVTPKESYEFTLCRQEIIPLGGIYTIWTNPDDREDRRPSCSIITLKPNSLVAGIHDRMPFILPPDAVSTWLDRNITDFDLLAALVEPYDPEKMSMTREGEGGPSRDRLF